MFHDARLPCGYSLLEYFCTKQKNMPGARLGPSALLKLKHKARGIDGDDAVVSFIV